MRKAVFMHSSRNLISKFLLLSLFFTLHDNVYSQIVNGNFNQPGTGRYCGAGTGWTTASGTSSAEYTNAVSPRTNFWIDLTPCARWGNGSYIEQQVPTVIGNCYYLKFDLGTICAWDKSDAGVYISIDGVQVGPRIFNDSFVCLPDKIYWETYTSQTFVATKTSTTIRFTGEGRCTKISPKTGTYQCDPVGSIGNPGVIALDNIEIFVATGTGGSIPPAYASINTGYYCDTGGGGVPITAMGVPASAVVNWSVIEGNATIIGAGQSINVTAKENSKILMKVADTALCSVPKLDTISIIVPTIKADMNIIDQRICKEDSIQFRGSYSSNPTSSRAKTIWYFGDGATSENISTGHSYTTPGPRTVWFVVSDSSICPISDTAVKIIDDPETLNPPYINIGPHDTTVCSEVTLELPLGISVRGEHYLWSDGSTSPRYYAKEEGVYIVKLFNDCGVSADTIIINHKNCLVWFPSAFSPNGDGVNDWARLTGTALAEIRDYELSIYNRFGNNVFITNDPYKGWDGKYNGIPQLLGTYYYYVRYTLGGEKYLLKGDIVLVR